MSVLEVSIYIHISHKGRFKGKGKAAALLEFTDSRGKVHTRTVKAAGDSTVNALTLGITVKALKLLIKPCQVTMYTGSRYIKSCVTNGWLKKWQQADWIKADGSLPANLDLWKEFYTLSQMHKLKIMPYKPRQEFNNGEDIHGKDKEHHNRL